MFSSPLRGISISTLKNMRRSEDTEQFSSPLRGISISTVYLNKVYPNEMIGFRPLFGVSLFLPTITILLHIIKNVFVPSSGYLYFYENKLFGYLKCMTVFVPSSGYLYFYTVRATLGKDTDEFSSPLRGISISTIRRNL